MTGSQMTTQLSRIVDSLIADSSDGLPDDLLLEAQKDPDKRDEEIDTLINYIENNREFI